MLFSIIVPVYNGERFLGRAIESVLKQTYNQWELILINDGSSDGSNAIMDSFEKQDCRIRCFSQDNAGVSRTRNRGIELANGDYLLFLDADDELVPDALKVLMQVLQDEKADVLIYNAHRIDTESKVIGTIFAWDQKESIYITTEQDKKRYLFASLASDKPFGFAWNFAVCRELAMHIRFPENMILCEDLIYHIQMHENARSVVCLADSLYYYRDNPAGCINNFNFRKLDDLRTAYEAKRALIDKYDLPECKEAVLRFFASAIIGFYYSLLDDRRKAEQYRQQVCQDAFVCKIIHEFREYRSSKKVSLDLVFGSWLNRACLRLEVRLKRFLRRLLHRARRK